jgi:hypothetical protein
MNSAPSRFKLSPRGVMVAVVSAAFANPALGNTGRVDFAVGNVTVTGLDGRGRPLARGAEVKTGDKIVSSADGRAQIRFSDGAYVSLQPNSEFDIKEYRFSGKADGKESALFGLFKGAMRTVTGLVGGVNRNRYQVSTPTATIGIRGTGGLISIGGDGSTLVTGSSGVWTLTNQGGSLDIPAGTAGFAGANVNLPPQPSADGPVLPPPQSGATKPLTELVQGDNVNSNGDPVSLFPALKSGPGFQFAGVAASTVAAAPILAPGMTVTSAAFDSAGQLTSFTSGGTTFTLAGTQADFGTLDGVIAWGRWTGQIDRSGATSVTLIANDGLHYVVGMPATSIPTSGAFTFNLIGGSRPTFGTPTAAPGVLGTLNSASLVGNFSGTFTVSLSASALANTFTTSATGTLAAGSPTFSASSNFSTLGCAGTCGFNVNGFFSGAGASHAGIVYQISNLTVGGSLNGTAALKQ